MCHHTSAPQFRGSWVLCEVGGTEMFQGRFMHPTHACQCFVHVRHGENKVKKMYSPSREQWFVQGSPMRAPEKGWKGAWIKTCRRPRLYDEGCGVGGRAFWAEATAHAKTWRHGKLTGIGTGESPNHGGVCGHVGMINADQIPGLGFTFFSWRLVISEIIETMPNT